MGKKANLSTIPELADYSHWLESFMETGWLPDDTTAEDWLLGMGRTQRVAMVAAGPNVLDNYMAEEDYMGTYNRCVLTQSPFFFLYFLTLLHLTTAHRVILQKLSDTQCDILDEDILIGSMPAKGELLSDSAK